MIARGRVAYKLKNYKGAKEDFKASLAVAARKAFPVIYSKSATAMGESENLTDQSENPA
jgi:hypothetical protein